MINVIWSKITNYPPNAVLADHIHDIFHYVYVIGGTGIMSIGNKSFTLKQGHIYLTPKGVNHAYTSDNKNPLSTLEIKFDITDDEDLIKAVKGFNYSLNIKYEPIEAVLRTISNEINSSLKYSKDIIGLNIQQFLIYLQREFQRQDIKKNNLSSESYNSSYTDAVKTSIKFMNENIKNKITLDDIINIACLEKSYFIKCFKKATGHTPMNMLKALRIDEAKNLLLYSDMNITQTSYLCGFQSVHHFSNVFFKETGTRPSEYKKATKI